MSTFAMLDSSGLISYTVTEGMPGTYIEGTVYGTLTAIRAPDPLPTDFVKLYYYAPNLTFKILPVKPSNYHTWDNTTETWVEPTNYLDILKTETLARIEAKAKTIKQKYIPETTEKLMTYLSQVNEAKAYALAGYPNNTNPYPWLKALAKNTGNSEQVEADILIAADETWNTRGSAVEDNLQGARNAIPQAPNKLVLSILEDNFNNAVSGF